MEFSPPPFFKQGPSARARFLFFSVVAITLLVGDARFNALVSIRKVIAMALYPVQRAVVAPGQWIESAGTYFTSLKTLKADNERLERDKTALAQAALLAGQLAAENTELRRLLGVRQQQSVQSVAAEVLYDARDPAARKIVLDRGTQDGLSAGLPVIDDAGVIGQVTRIFPFLAEVTLLTDKNQAIPVQNLRSGIRAVAYGGAPGGLLNLRFMAANADVKPGDMLVTSGLDGVFPAGLPVAKVETVDRSAAYAFAQILCVPVGGMDRNRHVLVLLPGPIPAPPAPEVQPEPRRTRRPPA